MADTKYTAANLPKNIRQIGTNIGTTKIYVEDYVYTYLHTPEDQEDWKHRGFLLLGRLERERESVRYFISGMIRLKDGFFKDDVLEFDDGTWAYIYQEMKKYYDDLEIVGWGQDVSGASASLTAELERNHKQNFNIQKNVLFLLDHVEKEEAFYVFEKNALQRREGYYVYYEKNPQMQEYMIAMRKSQELSVDSELLSEPDTASSYREMLTNKKKQIHAQRWNGLLYMTSMALVLAVCVLGVNTVNNVEKVQSLENTVAQISGQEQSGEEPEIPTMNSNVSETDTKDNSQISTQADTVIDSDGQADEYSDTESEKETEASQTDDDDEQLSSDSLDEMDSDQAATLSEAQTWLLQGYYIVRKGDSLVSISQKIYGTRDKVERICELNGIEDMDKIYIGQKLELP